jgi:hypothetical protein
LIHSNLAQYPEEMIAMAFNERAINAANKARSEENAARLAPAAVPAEPEESAAQIRARKEFERTVRRAFKHWCWLLVLMPGDLEGRPEITTEYFPQSSRSSYGNPYSMGSLSYILAPAGYHATLKFRVAGHDYTGVYTERDSDGLKVWIWIAPDHGAPDTQPLQREANNRVEVGKALAEEASRPRTA